MFPLDKRVENLWRTDKRSVFVIIIVLLAQLLEPTRLFATLDRHKKSVSAIAGARLLAVQIQFCAVLVALLIPIARPPNGATRHKPIRSVAKVNSELVCPFLISLKWQPLCPSAIILALDPRFLSRVLLVLVQVCLCWILFILAARCP
jgi:phosphatidylglycerophosphate synthase